MKSLLKVCAVIGICGALFQMSAFAEQPVTHDSLWRDDVTHDSLWREVDNHDSLWRETTPELGDSSIATTALVGLAGLALTGAVVAHKKSRSNAQ